MFINYTITGFISPVDVPVSVNLINVRQGITSYVGISEHDYVVNLGNFQDQIFEMDDPIILDFIKDNDKRATVLFNLDNGFYHRLDVTLTDYYELKQDVKHTVFNDNVSVDLETTYDTVILYLYNKDYFKLMFSIELEDVSNFTIKLPSDEDFYMRIIGIQNKNVHLLSMFEVHTNYTNVIEGE